jgi:predicted dehydrogenase
MTVKKTRVGIIGAGSVVELYHLPVLLAMPDVCVEWLCDKAGDRAKGLAGIHGVKRWCQGLDDCPDADIVLVAIPVGYRKPVVEYGMKRGWHLFCEKPFAASLSECESMISLAKANGLELGVGFMRRFYRSTLLAKSIVARSPFGPIQSVWASEGGRMRGTGRQGNWYQSDPRAVGGGVLMETGSHLIDQVATIVGARECSIENGIQVRSMEMDFESRTIASITTDRSERIRFGLAVSRIADLFNGIEVRYRSVVIRLHGTPDGTVDLCDQEGSTLACLGGGKLSGSVYRAFYDEWREFMAQCRDRRPSLVDAKSAYFSTAFIEQAYRFHNDNSIPAMPSNSGLRGSA